jgi:hypothetical protein
MNYQSIKKLQSIYGFTEMQNMINSGLAWHSEGSVGRCAAELLECGACMLPKIRRFDAYHNLVPSRTDLKEGTKGTYKNSVNFWTKVNNGEIELEGFS